MNRRQFFGTLFAGAAVPLLARRDPDAFLDIDDVMDELVERYATPCFISLANQIDTEVLRVGDIFTMAGPYAVNPPNSRKLRTYRIIDHLAA